MLDRVRFRIPRPALFQPVWDIQGFQPHHLDLDWLTKHERIVGRLDNLTISANQNNVFVTGSLITFAEGHNGTNWDLQSLEKTLCRLSEQLSLDLMDAEIMNFEFGAILLFSQPVDTYLSRLGSYPRAKRHRVDSSYLLETVCFKNTLRKLIIYDKGLEQGWENLNAIKVEHKWIRAEHTFKRRIYGADLLNQAFIDEVTRKFKREFAKIVAEPIISGNLKQDVFDHYRDFKLYCEIKALGGAEAFVRDRIRKVKSGQMHRSTKSCHIKKMLAVLDQIQNQSGCIDPFEELRAQVLAYEVA